VREHGDVERMGLRERDEIRADGLHQRATGERKRGEGTAETSHEGMVARRGPRLIFLA
jgi:hypothetical protein